MNDFPTQEEVLSLRKQYPKGTNVKLVKMNDKYREMPTGLKGIVESVDDAGTIHVSWENGSNLGIAYGEDECEKIEKVYAITEDYDVEEQMICESEKEGLLYFNTEIEALKYTKILIEGKLETRRKHLQKLNRSIENEKCEIFVLSERLSEISTELNLHKLESKMNSDMI